MKTPYESSSLPKGMKLPEPVIEEFAPACMVSLADVNYGKLIRDALAGIEEVKVQVVTLSIEEVAGEDAVARIEVVIMPKE